MDFVQTGISANDFLRQTEWRKQDIAWRENEALAIGVEQKERMVDLKCRALKSIANLSALVAGFTIVMFIELSVEETVPDWLVITYAATTSLEVAIMAMVMVQATLLLTCITLISMQHNDKKGFFQFWKNQCERQWKFTLFLFALGSFLFLLTLSFSACVKFYSTPGAYIVVITICAGSAMLWMYNWYVWGVYLYQGKEYYPLTVDELIEKNVRNMKKQESELNETRSPNIV